MLFTNYRLREAREEMLIEMYCTVGVDAAANVVGAVQHYCLLRQTVHCTERC